MSDKKKKIIIKSAITRKNPNKILNQKENLPLNIKKENISPKTKKVVSEFINSLFENEKPKLNKSFSPSQNKAKNKIKEHNRKKLIKCNNFQKQKEKSTPILKKDEMSPKATKKIVSIFINSLFEKEKPNLNKSFNPSHNKVKNINIKNNKKDIKEKSENKKRNKSSEKPKKNRNRTYRKNNIRININSNKSNKNINNNEIIINANYNTEKENKKNNRRIIRTENNAKTPNFRPTIGENMIRDEIAKEKKICAERLKIIKDHILSLQRKEEELSKKMMQLSNKENELNKKKVENIQEKVNETKLVNSQNVEKEEEKDKDDIYSNVEEEENNNEF